MTGYNWLLVIKDYLLALLKRIGNAKNVSIAYRNVIGLLSACSCAGSFFISLHFVFQKKKKNRKEKKRKEKEIEKNICMRI